MPTIVANFVSSISTKKKGDFASKMWASYTQLNPGVYSEAIATEFKRRMKPDYVDSAGTGYYYNTFGPSGLNKTTADWIYLLTCSGNLTQKSINKTGAVIKWNLDGSIISQNNPPIYTKGTNAGIITMTSTDGWSGVTTMSITTTNYSGILPRFQFTSYGGTTLAAWIICQMTGDIYINYGSIKPYVQRYYNNMFTTISGLSAMYSTNVAELRLDLNAFNTAEVNRVLAWINTYYATSPPIKNLTLNLSGATMGIPTGAGNNTDLLGILSKFATAGFTATIIVRTV